MLPGSCWQATSSEGSPMTCASEIASESCSRMQPTRAAASSSRFRSGRSSNDGAGCSRSAVKAGLRTWEESMAGASPDTKKPPRAWEERALDRARQQVLRGGYRVVRAARELVAEGGLDSVTLRALLKKTGLSRRAFYRHFESMDDVLLALFEDTMASGTAR